MRVVEPAKYKPVQADKKSHKKVIIILLLALPAVLVILMNQNKATAPENNDTIVQNSDSSTPDDQSNGQSSLRQFSGDEFRLFYDNLRQADLARVDVPPVISGNDIADARIRQIAELRGYKLRSSPTVTLPTVDGYQLHKSVHQPWLDLKAEATASGLTMYIVSAYRSVDEQRSLFLSRLNAEGVTISSVAAGTADESVNTVLITSSIPGYSKHHTGYTVDLQCAGFAFENFKNSPCYAWLSANNYEKAKQYGFIPSYPADATLQGPDPEAWEFVWVGADLLSIE